MNKQQYEKYLCSKINKQNNLENKKNYSQRIIDLTKELLECEEMNEDKITPDVNYSFENYIKTCIHYFKIIDNNQMIQEQYKELDDLGNNKEDLNDEIINLDQEDKEDQEGETFLENSYMKKSIKICNANLDSFVYKKKDIENEPK
jgi:hypothetical protein